MRHLFRSAAGLAVAVSATAAFAQDAPRRAVREEAQIQTEVQAQPRVKVQTQREVQKVPEQPVADSSAQQDDGRSIRASQLMGMELVLDDGSTLGKINDLIIDNANGQVAYVMVETDQDYRPVPWKAMVMQTGEQPSDHYFVIGMNREKFMQGPAIQRTEYQSFTGPQWQTQWHTYQPRVTQFYANVNTRVPADFRRTTNRELRAADRKIDQGARKANRKLD